MSALGASTMCEAFQLTASENPDLVALRTPGGEIELTFSDYADRVRSIAAGLAELGVKRGDTVGMMLLNRPEFNLCDIAAMHLGATPFSIYNTSAPEQIAYMFGNAGNRVVVTESQFLDAIQAADVEGIEHIVCVDGDPEGTIALDELEAGGSDDFDFEAAWRAVEPGDLITLCYTSGTTGPPKGVELTHANLMAEARGVWGAIGHEPGDRTTSYLPHAHMADRWTGHYAPLTQPMTVTIVAEIDDDGYVKIVDRRKELIINAAGKNMSPANIEARLKTSSPLIGQACCIGDRRPYNVALLVLDPDVSQQWATEQGLADASPAVLAEDDSVKAEVARGVEEANTHLSRVEQIKRFRVPVDWEPGGEELTPTMKLKRKPISSRYEAEIESLYS